MSDDASPAEASSDPGDLPPAEGWLNRDGLGRLIDRVIIPVFFLYGLVDYVWRAGAPVTGQQWIEFVLNVVRYSIVPIFLITSRRALKSRVSWKALLGIVLSLAVPPILISGPADAWNFGRSSEPFASTRPLAIFLVMGFYTVMVIVAYFNLGRNLSVTPQLKSVVTGGLYSVVRHPVYAATLHMMAVVTLVYPGPNNLICLISMNVGLYLRIVEEEALLRQSPEYAAYMETKPYRTYQPALSSPLFFLTVLRLLH